MRGQDLGKAAYKISSIFAFSHRLILILLTIAQEIHAFYPDPCFIIANFQLMVADIPMYLPYERMYFRESLEASTLVKWGLEYCGPCGVLV